jgi:hypothetical protein
MRTGSFRPERRFHAALDRQGLRQSSGRCRLKQKQRVIEIGFSNAVGADKDAEASDRETDRSQRAITGNRDVAKPETHGQSIHFCHAKIEARIGGAVLSLGGGRL